MVGGVDLLANHATPGLEELRVDLSEKDNIGQRHDALPYGLWLASLPCAATLRLLDLSCCDLTLRGGAPTPLPCVAFPSLADLCLRHCVLPEGYLQAVVDAAPRLAALRLVAVEHVSPEKAAGPSRSLDYYSGVRLRLRAAAVTDFILDDDMAWGYGFNEDEHARGANSGIYLDMPSLRSFRYMGYPVRLSLGSPATHLATVDLGVRRPPVDGWEYEPWARMASSFCHTTALTLRVHCVNDIVSGEVPVPLPTFPSLKFLELEGGYNYDNDNEDQALQCGDECDNGENGYQYGNDEIEAAMGALLRCCPAISELRLTLNLLYSFRHRRGDHPGRETTFRKSLDRFERFQSYMGSLDGAIEDCSGISELKALSNCKFRCLETSLRKVTLKFEDKEVNCFQAQLAKFLVENAMILEEMHINNGKRFFWEQLNHKVAKWRADSFRRRNLPSPCMFQVYHLPADPAVISHSYGAHCH